MAVDQYALCPCGSGKKIKFCKCADSLGDMDKVLKMVGGGQTVAAIDRLNQILAQHPGAAWALALKGRLLLAVNEWDALTENAERFIRLQPSNPIARAQLAASHVNRHEDAEAAQNLMEALAESRNNIDRLVVEVATIFAVSLMRTGKFLSARLYATLPLMFQMDQEGELAARVLSTLNGTEEVNLLLKSLPTVPDRPEDVAWGERYDEARALLDNLQVPAAESKLEALDRQFPGQEAILYGLYSCAIWRADVQAQQRLLRKLSEIEGMPAERAARLLATSYLVDPEMPDLIAEYPLPVFEVQDADATIATLTGHPQSRLVPREQYRSVEGEVPPRAVFEIYNRPAPSASDAITGETLPHCIAVAIVLGRETDQPARLRLTNVLREDLDQVLGLLGDAIDREKQIDSLPHRDFIMERFNLTPHLSKGAGGDLPVEEITQALQQLYLTRGVQRLAGFASRATGDKPLRDQTGDPSTQRVRTAFARLIYGFLVSEMPMAPSVMDEVHKLLEVDPLPPVEAETEADIEELDHLDLLSVDPDRLDDEGAAFLFERCIMAGMNSAINRIAERVATQAPTEDTASLIMRAHHHLMYRARSKEELDQATRKAKEWCAQYGIPDGPILLQEVRTRLLKEDAVGATNAIQSLTANYSHDHNLMFQLQQFLVQMGILNPDGSPRMMPGAAPQPQSGSGLWTGDAPAPAAAPAGAGGQPQSSGGSKLWLPGMD